MANNRTLVAIFAHPDDEAFGTGGTLTKYAREGVDVHLIMATRGEAGRIANPAISLNNQPLGSLRERELRCACEHYGLKQLHFLGYIDGQTPLAPLSEAVFKLVQLLRQLKPQVVMSFGPEGIYGHFDHLVVHRWVTAAVALAAEAERWPEAGPVHRVAKLYYRAMPQEQVERMKERFGRTAVAMDGIPFPFVGYPEEQITTVINTRQYAWIKARAIRCHASQLNPDTPMLQPDFDPEANAWFYMETFILARNCGAMSPLPTNGKEGDLFAGVK
jgi:LmbE family N-acetylglucosaminyl deacetylase